jgi:hypothetical protein
MKFDIIWSNSIPIIGNKSVMFQTSAQTGFMFLDTQRWCDAHNKICAHFGFIVVAPGPLGELSGQPIATPEL